MPLINEGVSRPDQVLGLRRSGLDFIETENGSHRIGACCTLTSILRWNQVPLLSEAANSIGGWAIRNMATVGGNLFAPPPAGDFAAALLALDATLKLVSSKNEHSIPLQGFYTGFMTTALEPGELVAEITVDQPAGLTAFTKYGRRQANTPAIVTVAAHLVMDGSIVQSASIALNAVGPHPFRAKQAESLLAGRPLNQQSISDAANAAAQESQPFTDPLATEWYRRKMVSVYVTRTLEKIAQEEK
jgi:CO/xanthine dehydrogenase FAD-binding subunit